MRAEAELTGQPALDHPVVPRGRRLVAVAAVASLALLGACSDDDETGGVEPADQSPAPGQQPEGDDDPTLSGEDTEGVGEGETGAEGSGSPDSGSEDGEAEDSPTAGEDG